MNNLDAAIARAISEQNVELRDEAGRQFRALAATHGRGPVPWEAITSQGWQKIAIDESANGVGAGWSALAMVLIEAGRHLVNAPLLSTVGLAGAFLAAAGPAAAPHLRRIADGAAATLGYHGPDAPGPDPATGVSFDGRLLRGEKTLVTDADRAQFLVVSLIRDGVGCVAVVSVPEHVSVRPMSSLDLGRPLSTVRIDADPTDVVPVDLPLGTALAEVALAADLVGVARGALDMAVAYASVREQFDRPIGSFQALKHRLADALVATEKAESLVLAASGQYDLPNSDGRTLCELAHMAKAAAADAATFTTGVNVQVHAAIAMTAEHGALHYLRRARQGAALLGDARRSYESIGLRFLAQAGSAS